MTHQNENNVDETHISQDKLRIKTFSKNLKKIIRILDIKNLENKSFLDIGSASGACLKSLQDLGFQEEGYETLELGLSPFSKLPHHPYKNSLLLKQVFKLIYKLNIPNYAYQGIADYHQKFHGKQRPIFFASPGPFPIRNLWQTWTVMARRE